MNEQRFIQRNKEKWQEFETALAPGSYPQPDRLSELYLHLMDDLSYARTHYPGSHLIGYLNQLAVQAHRLIYRTKQERRNRIITFFTREVPEAFADNRRFLWYSTMVFAIAVLIGVASTSMEPSFTRTIMGDSYVNMTLENIEKGDPMAVYKSIESDDMFGRIVVNNVRVAFVMYLLGILAGIPTILLLLTNGVMVGAFIQFFIARGLGWTAFSTIFLHGALELSAIVVVGACGLLLGSSTLFPGTYSRGYALVRGAKTSLKLVIGIVPFIVVAALIEGYLTRLYLDLSGSIRLLVILGTFAVLVWYVIIYPMKFRTHV